MCCFKIGLKSPDKMHFKKIFNPGNSTKELLNADFVRARPIQMNFINRIQSIFNLDFYEFRYFFSNPKF